MTPQQEKLVLQIIAGLNTDITGQYPNQHCQYCTGESDGYYDYQYFTHKEHCIVPLIDQLRDTLEIESENK